MIRRPYRVACTPWRDSTTEVTLHWYVTNPDNGVLPYPSRINSLWWRPDNLNPAPVGEVSFADQEFDGWQRIVPPMPQDHICGERSDFEFGGVYDDTLPPLERDIDGIPWCCRGPLGGVVLSGVAPVAFPEVVGGSVVLSGSAIMEGALCTYEATATSPVQAHPFTTGLPCGGARQWGATDGSGWILSATAPRGTVGNWVLRDTVNVSRWETTAWDGLGCRVFTLVSGPGAGVVTVCETS